MNVRKFKPGGTVTTLLQQLATLQYKLAGVRMVVARQQLAKDDLSLQLTGAVSVRFMNRGQHTVILDNQIVLEPGDNYTEGDSCGPGMNHDYSVRFLPPAGDLPAAVPPVSYPGNYLDIRILKREY